MKNNIIRNKYGYDCNLNKKYGVEWGLYGYENGIKTKNKIHWCNWKRYNTLLSSIQAYMDFTKDGSMYRVVEIIYDESEFPGFYSKPFDLKILERENKLKRINEKKPE